jgi:hypothetical protein
MGPTASGTGSPYSSTRSVSALRSLHRMRAPQKAMSVRLLTSAKRTTALATLGSSSSDSMTVPSAAHVSRPWMNTPGMGVASLGMMRCAHGPRLFPVARTSGTVHKGLAFVPALFVYGDTVNAFKLSALSCSPSETFLHSARLESFRR